MKLFLVSLYFLIWGEAASVHFLPECLCYLFHHMARELDATLDSGEASPVASCVSEDNSVSFLAHVIQPIYDTLSKERKEKLRPSLIERKHCWNLCTLILFFT